MIRMFRPVRAGVVCVLASGLLMLVACGGGGGSTGGGSTGGVVTPPVVATPPATVASAVATGTPGQPLVSLNSDAGDFVGQGAAYSYDNSNAVVQLTVRGSYVGVEVRSRERWSGSFQLPGAAGELQPGRYANLVRPGALGGTASGSIDWSGEGRGCNIISGSVDILSVSYQAGVLQSLDLAFEQHCEGKAPALKGRIRVSAAEMASVMPPQNGAASQPIVALVSQAGDYVGGGRAYSYDMDNANIRVTATGARLSVQVTGDQNWTGDFQLPGNGTTLVAGTYDGLTRYPFQAAGAGALSWSGEGRGCNTVTGSMVINAVQYDGAGQLAAIDMDFDHHCEGAAAALRGHIAWSANATPAPPAPLAVAPAGLWAPPSDAMPGTANAMYVASDWGDYIGAGYLYKVGGAVPTGTPSANPGDTRGTVTVALSESAGLLKLSLVGAVNWDAQFKAMDGLAHLQPGYYGIVQRYPLHNPRRGGMSISMDGRGCNQLTGWFMVDSVRYDGDKLAAVDLRFAQYCDNNISALRGRVRWDLGAAIR